MKVKMGLSKKKKVTSRTFQEFINVKKFMYLETFHECE
jgi:hypothetical protein